MWVFVALSVAEAIQTHLENFDTRSYRLKQEGVLRETTGRKNSKFEKIKIYSFTFDPLCFQKDLLEGCCLLLFLC